MRGIKPMRVEDRFLRHIKMGGDDECWVWLGHTYNGYGRFMPRDHACIRAHQMAYAMWVGDLPKGMVIDHTCRNRACVNPRHLEAVTQAENLRRSPLTSSGRPNCPKCGRPYPLPRKGGCHPCNRARINERYRTDPAFREMKKRSSIVAHRSRVKRCA